jgi:hypothetical protein
MFLGKNKPRSIPRGSATPLDNFEESPMKFADPTKLRQEIRGSMKRQEQK